MYLRTPASLLSFAAILWLVLGGAFATGARAQDAVEDAPPQEETGAEEVPLDENDNDEAQPEEQDAEEPRTRLARRIEALLGDAVPPRTGDRMTGWRSGDPLDREVLEPFEPASPRAELPWYRRLRMHGEVAAISRYRITEAGNSNVIPGYGIDRLEWQLRVQLGLVGEFDPMRFGILLGTGPTRRDAAATLGDDFTPNPFFVRQAWGTVHVADDAFAFTLGRHPFPTRYSFRSMLTFDPDVALTGAHARGTLFETTEQGRVASGMYLNAFGFILDEMPTEADTYGFAGTASLLLERLWITAGFWGVPRARDVATNLEASNTELYALEAAVQAELAFVRGWAHVVWNFAAAGDNIGVLVGANFGERERVGDVGAEAAWYWVQRDAWVTDWTDPDAGNLFGGGIVGSTGARAAFVWVAADGLVLRLQGTLAWTVDSQRPGDDNDLFGSGILELSFRF